MVGNVEFTYDGDGEEPITLAYCVEDRVSGVRMN